jgi:ABC-type uncharacterized transport system permease subunit
MLKIDRNPPDRQLRQFGIISLFGFPLIGLVLHRVFGIAPAVIWVMVGVGLVTLVLSRIEPRWIRWIYVGLMLVAAPIGFVVSVTLMAAVYYLMVTPFGLVFRAFGRDPLAKRPDRTKDTYWHERDPVKPAASYLKLY